MRTSAQITESIRAVAPHLRITRTRAIGMREMIEERRPKVEFAITNPAGEGDPEHVGNAKSHPFSLSQTPVVAELMALEYSLTVLEQTDAYKEAVAILDPLHTELEAALAAEQAQREIEAELEAKVATALEEAERKAKENLDNDPAVKAARAALEKAAGRSLTSQEIEDAKPAPLTILDHYNADPDTSKPPGKITLDLGGGRKPKQESAAEELAADLH